MRELPPNIHNETPQRVWLYMALLFLCIPLIVAVHHAARLLRQEAEVGTSFALPMSHRPPLLRQEAEVQTLIVSPTNHRPLLVREEVEVGTSIASSNSHRSPIDNIAPETLVRHKPAVKEVGLKLGTWQVGALPDVESALVSASLVDGQIHVSLTVEAINTTQAGDCYTSEAGCELRWYIEGKYERTGGNYMTRDSIAPFRYHGHEVMYEAGDALASYRVEIVRNRQLEMSDTINWNWRDRPRRPRDEYYRDGVVVSSLYEQLPLGGEIERLVPQDSSQRICQGFNCTVLDNNFASQNNSWARSYFERDSCQFRRDQLIDWGKTSWVSKELLLQRGLEVDDFVGTDEFVFLPRGCRLPSLTQKRLEVLSHEVQNKTHGVIIGTSRIRETLGKIATDYLNGNRTNADYLENIDSARENDNHLQFSKNLYLTSLFASTLHFSVSSITRNTRYPPLNKLCVKTKRPQGSRLLLLLSIGVWESRTFPSKTEEEFENYFESIFESYKTNCGPQVEFGYVIQPSIHLWHARVPDPVPIPGEVQSLNVFNYWGSCQACVEATHELVVARSQRAALKVAKRYNAFLIDLHEPTRSNRRNSKDGLHYLPSGTETLGEVLLIGLLQMINSA